MTKEKNKMILKSSLYYHYLKPVIFELKDIDYAIIKGEPLSFYSYGAYGQRYFNDIDILVDRMDVAKIKKTLEKHGFYVLTNDRSINAFSMLFSHQAIPYVKRIGNFNIYIDINFDIYWGEYKGKRISIKDFLNDTISMCINDVNIKTLNPLKTFIQLSLHDYKDLNSIYLLVSNNKIDKRMFKDLYNLLIRNTKYIDEHELLSMCKYFDVQPYIYYMLAYLDIIYNDMVIKKYLNRLYCEEGVQLLDFYGLCDSEKHRWNIDIATRIKSDNLYQYIKDNLSEKDKKKVEINSRIYGME